LIQVSVISLQTMKSQAFRFSCQLQATEVSDILLATGYHTFSNNKPLLNKLLQTKSLTQSGRRRWGWCTPTGKCRCSGQTDFSKYL